MTIATWSGLSKAAAVLSNVASSKFHFGDAICQISFWWQRIFTACLVADQITTHGDKRLAAIRPDCSYDIGRARSPIKSGNDCLLYFERIHERDDIDRNHRLLSIANRFS